MWARIAEFENSFKLLCQKMVEKLGDPEGEDLAEEAATESAPAVLVPSKTGVDLLDGVEIQDSPSMGRILIATRGFKPREVILLETPDLLLHRGALERVSKLSEALSLLPEDLQLDDYQGDVSDMPPYVLEHLGEHPELLQLYMVVRVNGMQWGQKEQLALCRTASKASHSCSPTAAFAQRGRRESSATGSHHVLEVQAMTRLSPRDQVSFSYFEDSEDLLCPTSIRRRILHSQRRFLCQCHRCASVEDEPCRSFPCSCGRTMSVAAESLDLDKPRYAPSVTAQFHCRGCQGRDAPKELLKLEAEVAEEFASILQALGQSTVAHIRVHAAFQGSEDLLLRTSNLYTRSTLLGKRHWLRCRAALLQWQVQLAQFQSTAAVPEVALLREAMAFVEETCPHLVDLLLPCWTVEAARFLHEVSPVDALRVRSEFFRWEPQGFFNDCEQEPWLRYLRGLVVPLTGAVGLWEMD